MFLLLFYGCALRIGFKHICRFMKRKKSLGKEDQRDRERVRENSDYENITQKTK